jgi:hypothetical protein
MEVDTPITPTAYLRTLRALISSGRDQAALDYAARVWPTIAGQLTAEQLDIASGLLEGAESALALAEWEAAQRSAGAKPADFEDRATSQECPDPRHMPDPPPDTRIGYRVPNGAAEFFETLARQLPGEVGASFRQAIFDQETSRVRARRARESLIQETQALRSKRVSSSALLELLSTHRLMDEFLGPFYRYLIEREELTWALLPDNWERMESQLLT